MSDDDVVSLVELDALVVMRIMKHCRQQMPHAVTGQLLGLDQGENMQVTGCFPYKNKPAETSYDQRQNQQQNEDPAEGEQNQIDMLRALREVNLDSNTVGWYQSAYLGSFLNDTFVETQYLYQEQIAKSVVLVFDPLQCAAGRPPFKAFRLSLEFMRRQRDAKDQNNPFGPSMKDFSSEQILLEVPIQVQAPLLVEAFVVDWVLQDQRAMSARFDGLDLENQAFLEKNVQFLLDCLDDLSQEQQKLQNYERQAARGQPLQRQNNRFRGPAQPRHLDTMLIAKQIQTYCKQINNFSSDAFGKLFLVANKPVGAN